ncbi:unnamed protein product [Symbiodinium microadriaticum]|nr:unnamed protein product [Symbiodinium microadriaticum]
MGPRALEFIVYSHYSPRKVPPAHENVFSGNFDHGAWKSGDKLEAKRDVFEEYLSQQDESFFESFAERVASDRGTLYDPELDPGAEMHEWMTSRALRNRGQYDRTGNPDKEPSDAEDEEPEEQRPEPRTKTELYKIFNTAGPTNMVAGFMSDRRLQQTARLIVVITQPLEAAYYAALETASGGWHHQSRFASERVLGSFWETVEGILRTLCTATLHDMLQLTKATRAHRPADLPEWAQQETATLQTCHEFAVHLASNVFWANAKYWMSIPELIASTLSKNPEERAAAMEHTKALIEAVLAAENWVSADPLWKLLLSDLAWHKQQLPRETMALCLQSDFDDRNVRLRKLAKRLYLGTATTKDNLESTFAYLHRKAVVHSTNYKMSDSCKYLYTITSPYAESGGCPQLLPERDDFATVLGVNGLPEREFANKHLFSTQKTELPKPEVLHRPKAMFEAKWQNSGVLAHQRSSAAAAYIMLDRRDNWSHLDLCWIGSFFKAGLVYKHEDDDEYLLSLGFRKWCAAGYPLHIKWMTCFDLKGPWKLIPSEPALRAYTPQELLNQGISSAWRVLDMAGVSLLEGGLKAGVFLTLPDLKQLCGMLSIDIPVKGSGKNQNVLKADIARKLIDTLFSEASAEEKKRMVAAITWQSSKKLTEHEETILKCCAQLAEEDRECPEFRKIAEVAKKTMKERDRKSAAKEAREKMQQEIQQKQAESSKSEPAAAAAAASAQREPPKEGVDDANAAAKSRASGGPRRPAQTPDVLKELLRSPVMQSECSLLRDPEAYGYKANYPSRFQLHLANS